MSTNQTLSTDRKQQIAEDLRNYVQNVAGGSANKASKQLTKVSGAYISHMLNGKWDAISDEAWRNVAIQVMVKDWVAVETRSSKGLNVFFEDARLHANVFGIIAEAGTGKTFTGELFTAKENVFMVKCNEWYNRKTFLSELLRVMGKDSGGYTVADMMHHIITSIQRAENPIIILDEADKLSDQVLYFFITLYNMLEGKCGIVLMATDHLEKRIEKGLRLNRKGYKEIYSRLGRKFIPIPKPNDKDITAICLANGVQDALTVKRIINESEGDLRRVKRLVHAEKNRG
ncbi:ATP-binding protein [Litoribacter populi]|uniref:ATP-binding protein n=1 Tax=Litoribacter populi TaxID=2598460 RepID=UPI00117CFB77|nr:ATP-binding protein [Litoribacter populi]